VVIGNCVGIVSIAGSRLSYCASVEGINPMRYTGGLLGGTWLTSLAGDLANGCGSTLDAVDASAVGLSRRMARSSRASEAGLLPCSGSGSRSRCFQPR
jgi:Protein of unknown function (DUF3141)